jgi:negative regulator of flagellin synthesis FlgM
MVDSVSSGLATAAPRVLPSTPIQNERVALPLPAGVKIENIKSLPKLISLASELASQGPPIDHAKIARIREAIALGTYRVQPEAIANAILGFGDKDSE